MHGKVINDVNIMVLFAPCVDDNTLAIIHVNLVLRLVLYLHMHTGMCNCTVSPHHEYIYARSIYGDEHNPTVNVLV